MGKEATTMNPPENPNANTVSGEATTTNNSTDEKSRERENTTIITTVTGRDTRTRRASATAAAAAAASASASASASNSAQQPSTPAATTRRTRRKRDELDQEKEKETPKAKETPKGKEKETPKDKLKPRKLTAKARKEKEKVEVEEKEQEKNKEKEESAPTETRTKAKEKEKEAKKETKKEIKPRSVRRGREKSNASAATTPQSSRKKPKLEHNKDEGDDSSHDVGKAESQVSKDEDEDMENSNEMTTQGQPAVVTSQSGNNDGLFGASSSQPQPQPPQHQQQSKSQPPQQLQSQAQSQPQTPVVHPHQPQPQPPAQPQTQQPAASSPSIATSHAKTTSHTTFTSPPNPLSAAPFSSSAVASTPPTSMHALSLTRSHSVENMLSMHTTASYMTPTHHQPQPPPPPPSASTPRSSGRNYDPIRSAFGNSAPAPAPKVSQVSQVSHPPSSSRIGTPILSSQTHLSPPQHNSSPQRAYRASASPAIASIIDPPSAPMPAQQPLLSQSHSTYSGHPSYGSSVPTSLHQYAQSPPPNQAPTLSQITIVSSPSQHLPGFSTTQGSPHSHQPWTQHTQYPTSRQDQPSTTSGSMPGPPTEKISLLQQPVNMEIDSEPATKPAQASETGTSAAAAAPTAVAAAGGSSGSATGPKTTKPAKKDKPTSTAPPSSAPSPKPLRPGKDNAPAPPPLPQGSGLITGALFGVDDNNSSSASKTAPNIILHVPLSRDSNKIISFARLAEEKYGFAALHPRIAAQKERLARVAAAGAALEKDQKGGGSALESAEDDLSDDIDRDSDADGDITMGGVGGGSGSGGLAAPEDPADGKKKRRKKKIEEYDRDDPFVDDSELVWQEQAAASKDGFFVYSGPLVAEGEKVQVERADGTIKRGRGGRGRGGARARGAHTHVPIASNVPVSAETGLPLRGPGSRGGSMARKPRTTKAKQQGDDKSDSRVTSTSKPGGGLSKAGSKASTSSTNITGLAGITSAASSVPQLAPAPAPGSGSTG